MHLLTLALTDAGIRSCPKDATHLIRTDESFGEAKVDLNVTFRRIATWYKKLPDVGGACHHRFPRGHT